MATPTRDSENLGTEIHYLSLNCATNYAPIVFCFTAFFLLSYLGTSNDRVSDVGRVCFMIAMPIISGSVAGFFMLDKPQSFRFLNIGISSYALGAFLGAFLGAAIFATVLLINVFTIYSEPSITLQLGSLISSLLLGSLLGLPLGALGSTSVIARRYSRNLSIALVGGIGSLILEPVNIHYYNYRPFLYLVGFSPLLAIMLSVGLRYGKRKLEAISFSKISILSILLSSAWLGTCLGIWLKLRILSLLLILSALISIANLFFILLRHWLVNRKLFQRD